MKDQNPELWAAFVDEQVSAELLQEARQRLVDAMMNLALQRFLVWAKANPDILDTMLGKSLGDVLGETEEAKLMDRIPEAFGPGGLASFAGRLEIKLHAEAGLDPHVHLYFGAGERADTLRLRFT